MSAVQLVAKVPPELADALRRRATASDRSLSAELRVALRGYLNVDETSESAPAQDASAKTSDHRAPDAG